MEDQDCGMPIKVEPKYVVKEEEDSSGLIEDSGDQLSPDSDCFVSSENISLLPPKQIFIKSEVETVEGNNSNLDFRNVPASIKMESEEMESHTYDVDKDPFEITDCLEVAVENETMSNAEDITNSTEQNFVLATLSKECSPTVKNEKQDSQTNRSVSRPTTSKISQTEDYCLDRPFFCVECFARFKRETHLNDHLHIHSDDKPFSCERCGAKFAQKSNYTTHSIICSGEKPFCCNQCPARFARKRELTTHSFTHTGEKPFSCEQCSAQFTYKNHLKEHMRSHTGEKPFSCGQCDLKFSRVSHLRYHERSKHDGEKPHACHQCPAKFVTRRNLNDHLLRHSGEKPFPCDQCSLRFASKRELKRHSTVHTGEKPFPCELCSKRFRQKGDLKRHLNTHSKNHFLEQT